MEELEGLEHLVNLELRQLPEEAPHQMLHQPERHSLKFVKEVDQAPLASMGQIGIHQELLVAAETQMFMP
jgi:hypothetical protein